MFGQDFYFCLFLFFLFNEQNCSKNKGGRHTDSEIWIYQFLVTLIQSQHLSPRFSSSNKPVCFLICHLLTATDGADAVRDPLKAKKLTQPALKTGLQALRQTQPFKLFSQLQSLPLTWIPDCTDPAGNAADCGSCCGCFLSFEPILFLPLYHGLLVSTIFACTVEVLRE